MQDTWEELMGPDISAHTKVGAWDEGNGLLTVECDSAAWRAQLIVLREQLVDRLNEHLGRGTVYHIAFNAPDDLYADEPATVSE